MVRPWAPRFVGVMGRYYARRPVGPVSLIQVGRFVLQNKKRKPYVMLGDGECQEGSIWEGALSAPTLKLDNLTVIVDHNKLQAMDRLENIVNMRPFADKWRAFGWNVLEIDGHNYGEIHTALTARVPDKPTLVVANTIKGKGVSFMEGVPIWHYRMPNDQELPVLMRELGLTEDDLKPGKAGVRA